MIGKTLGQYKILDLLGKGGMGEVYRASDPKLDRDVAIKVLPEEFAKDEERLLRFQREAKLLASLDHRDRSLHRTLLAQRKPMLCRRMFVLKLPNA